MKEIKTMKCILLALILIVPISSLTYGNSRYFHVGTAQNNNDWYIDTQSLQYAKNTDIVQFWCISILSASSHKEEASNISINKYYFSVNLSLNKYFLIELQLCDNKGEIIKSYKLKQQSWNNVVPASTMEVLLGALREILNEKERHPLPTQQSQINNGIGNIIMFSLLIGAVISVLAVFVCKALFPDTSSSTIDVHEGTEMNNNHTPEYIDVEFTEKASDKGFDYPYEDIGDALR